VVSSCGPGASIASDSEIVGGDFGGESNPGGGEMKPNDTEGDSPSGASGGIRHGGSHSARKGVHDPDGAKYGDGGAEMLMSDDAASDGTVENGPVMPAVTQLPPMPWP